MKGLTTSVLVLKKPKANDDDPSDKFCGSNGLQHETETTARVDKKRKFLEGGKMKIGEIMDCKCCKIQ